MEPFAFVTVASRLHDTSSIDRVTEPVRTLLDRLGGRPVPTAEAAGVRPMVVLVATGGTEKAVLGVVEARRALIPFEPVVLVAHPSHNSLPAAMEVMAALDRRGIGGRIVYAGDQDTPGHLGEAIRDLVALHRIHGTRLGAVGAPSEWLVASMHDPEVVRGRWGVEVVPVDVASVVDRWNDSSQGWGAEVAVALGGVPRHGVDEGAVRMAARVHPALADVISSAGVDAVTVRCFDLLAQLETSGCVALATLNDEGIVAGCEGDVPAALAMLVFRHLLELPSWVANPSRLETRSNRLVLAHCTVAPSMVVDHELSTHFESGIGVGISGRFAAGPVTLLRIGGARLDRFWCADADVVATGDSPDLCRTQVTVELRDRRVAELLEHPLGNHLVLALGHHRPRIESWWRFAFGDDGAR